MQSHHGFARSANQLLLIAICLVAALRPIAAHANVTLSWNDNSLNESGFRIERSDDGGPFRLLATVPANTESYTDANVQQGVAYDYRVNAYNAYGASGFTNVANVVLPRLESYQQWIARMIEAGFLDQTPLAPETSLGASDLPNLLCYAHGINPFRPDRSLLPHLRVERRRAYLVRAVNRFSIGLKTTLFVSRDLVHWTPKRFKAKTLRETATHRWERIPLPQNGGPLFFRLEITLDAAPGGSPF